MVGTTDPQEELLTQVDEKNQVVGGISRKEAHGKGGIYYRTIYVLIINEKGEVLVQKRSPTKDLYPDCWDISVGGHVDFRKSYEETAVREVGEEMGIKITETDLVYKGEVLVKLPKSKEFFYVFEYHIKPGDKIISVKEEVAETGWMTIPEIKKSMREKTREWYARPEQVVVALY